MGLLLPLGLRSSLLVEGGPIRGGGDCGEGGGGGASNTTTLLLMDNTSGGEMGDGGGALMPTAAGTMAVVGRVLVPVRRATSALSASICTCCAVIRACS